MCKTGQILTGTENGDEFITTSLCIPVLKYDALNVA